MYDRVLKFFIIKYTLQNRLQMIRELFLIICCSDVAYLQKVGTGPLGKFFNFFDFGDGGAVPQVPQRAYSSEWVP